MSDLITINTNSLEEAIRCAICENPIKSGHGCDGSCKYDEKLLKRIIEEINGCIEEQRPHGEWVDTGYGTKRCSVCGEKCQTYCMDKPRDRYCLWCGASMRKEGEAE